MKKINKSNDKVGEIQVMNNAVYGAVEPTATEGQQKGNFVSMHAYVHVDFLIIITLYRIRFL